MTERPADPIVTALRMALRETAARKAAALAAERGKMEPTPIRSRKSAA